jgi:hypothetical protein
LIDVDTDDLCDSCGHDRADHLPPEGTYSTLRDPMTFGEAASRVNATLRQFRGMKFVHDTAPGEREPAGNVVTPAIIRAAVKDAIGAIEMAGVNPSWVDILRDAAESAIRRAVLDAYDLARYMP